MLLQTFPSAPHAPLSVAFNFC